MPCSAFRPLALGSPRSGFTLLCSILNHMTLMRPCPMPPERVALRAAVSLFGPHIFDAVGRALEDAGHGAKAVLNPAFRDLTRGPKWLREAPSSDQPSRQACVRKYVGVRGLGDFTLVTAHPRQVLDFDAVIHSHVGARAWASHPAYADHTRFASIRDPAGIVASSTLSINALTSEYIQHHRPPEEDTPEVRQALAMRKLTDPAFFEGVVRFYKGWFTEFLPVIDAYAVMRWEDLMERPVETIQTVAQAADLPMDADHAAQIWQTLAHRNLTNAHAHNYRPGGGVVDGWTRWLTNQHLEILRDHGFEPIREALGYAPLPTLDTNAYTPFQRTVAERLDSGTLAEDHPDPILAGFAFNKSNIDSSAFAFRQHPWKIHSRIERADFRDEALMHACWDAAEQAAGRLNAVFEAILSTDADAWQGEAPAIRAVIAVADAQFRDRMPKAMEALPAMLSAGLAACRDVSERGAPFRDGEPPRLIRSVGRANIVTHQGLFHGLPWEAGPLDPDRDPLDQVPGAVTSPCYETVLEALQDRAAPSEA